MPTGISEPRRLSRPVVLVAFAIFVAIIGELVFSTIWSPFGRKQGSLLGDSGLVIPAARLNFGEVWEDTQFKWLLPIENPLTHDVQIKDFASNCTCAAIEPRSLIIPAGQIREIDLTLDLSATRSKQQQSEWRDFQVTLHPITETNPRTTTNNGWTLSASIHSAIYFDTPSLDFGRQPDVSQPIPPKSFLVHSYFPLRGLTVETDSRLLDVKVKPLTNDPTVVELLVAPCVLPVGPLDTRVAVVPRLTDSTQLPKKFFNVTGRIVNDVQTSPPEIVFGARHLGEILDEEVTLYSLTNQSFAVTDVKVEGKGILAEKTDAATRLPGAYSVRLGVSSPGHQTGRIVFRVRTERGRDVQIPVRVSYIGIDPVDN